MAVPAYNRNPNRLEVLNKLDDVQSRIVRICVSHPLLAQPSYALVKDKLLQASLDLVAQVSYANSLSMKNKWSAKMRLEAQYEGRKYMYQLVAILQTVLRLEDCIDTKAFEDVLAVLNGEFKTLFYGWTAKTLQTLKACFSAVDTAECDGSEDTALDECAESLLAHALDGSSGDEEIQQ